MDTSITYSEIAKNVLRNYVNVVNQGDNEPLHVAFDDEHHSYLVLNIGWQGKKYIHSATLHLEIIGSKIWIQSDNTEEGIATDLLEAGVPKDDIVLGFRHPKIRKYTEFADIAAPPMQDAHQQPSAIAA